MRRLWLIFAQTVTFCVAILFVVQTLKPEWLTRRAPEGIAEIKEAAPTPNTVKAVGSYADAARKAVPAVVHIYTSQEVRSQRQPFLNDPLFRHFFGGMEEQPQRRSGLGSGVIVSVDGYILTNNHVVEGADEIEVALNDSRKFSARVVGTDPDSDVAVLRIKAGSNLPVITFGSAESLRVGDVVLAIGNPFGVGQTVTSGIVSALGRSHLGINTFENFIQTDAAINPGNSGGALVDSSGNLIGINTAIYSQSGGSMGIGFAIPVSLARNVMEQIIRNGSVTRGWVGIEVQEITPDLAESFHLADTHGVLVAGIQRGSPAEHAGFKSGDVLLEVNDKPVDDVQTMMTLIAALQPGQTGRFKLRRNARDLALQVEVGKRPSRQRDPSGE
jgi:Do/DeqQ family serine protease